MMTLLLLLLACSGSAPAPAPDAPAVDPGPDAPSDAPEVDAPAEEAPAPCVDTATKRYVGDKDECPRIRFSCDAGEQYFSDDCGCGCETTAP